MQLIVQHITMLELGMTQGDAFKTIRHFNLTIPRGDHLRPIIYTNLNISLRSLRFKTCHNQSALSNQSSRP